ncbi:MAG: hypothetical protein ILNGONEN_00791 [Syntrophorhabdaceae bacterium]|jgi:hypothetical protein|nr:hypothetical protein [Syntrophorhabdaceae bacterium]
MLIAIEGPDGSGKTQLARTLQTAFRASLLTRSGPTRNFNQLSDELTWLSQHPSRLLLICDRIRPISELVYGKVLRGFSMLEEDVAYSWVDHFVSIVIYCRPPLATIQANVEASFPNQMSGVVEHTQQLSDEYDRVMLRFTQSNLIYYPYDYTFHHLPALIEEITSDIKGIVHP